MSKLVAAIIGFFAGRRLVASDPQSLLIGVAILEGISLILAFSGNPIGGFTAAATGFVLAALGIRNGAGAIRCFICGFFQFFFVLGIIVVPESAGSYFLMHLVSMAYPVIKALL